LVVKVPPPVQAVVPFTEPIPTLIFPSPAVQVPETLNAALLAILIKLPVVGEEIPTMGPVVFLVVVDVADLVFPATSLSEAVTVIEPFASEPGDALVVSSVTE